MIYKTLLVAAGLAMSSAETLRGSTAAHKAATKQATFAHPHEALKEKLHVVTLHENFHTNEHLKSLADEFRAQHPDSVVEKELEHVHMLFVRPSAEAKAFLRAHPHVSGVFEDQMAQVSPITKLDDVPPISVDPIIDASRKLDEVPPISVDPIIDGRVRKSDVSPLQNNPYSWGLDRIDQPNLPLDGNSFILSDIFNYGDGVDVYVLDTGIMTNHDEFSNTDVRTVSNDWAFDNKNGVNNDGYGHGSHVAGTVGGINVGVAKNANIHGIRVLDDSGSGSFTYFIDGCNYILGIKKSNPSMKMIATASLGGGMYQPANDAAAALAKGGVPFTIAAGNSNADACNASPASAANVITVAATTNVDARAYYSNYGSCVEIFAPGSSINSVCAPDSVLGSGCSGTNSYLSISGTSMATPHVAGAFAASMGHKRAPKTIDPAAAKYYIQCMAVPNKVSDPQNSPNGLLQAPHPKKVKQCIRAP